MVINRKFGASAYTVLIDRRDLPLYRRHRWQRHKKGMIRYRGKNKGNGCVLLHRAILKAKPTDFVEFKNGNKLDVRRENIAIRNDAEWRARKRHPFIITRARSGRPTGVSFPVKTYRWRNSDRTTVVRYARACFSYRGNPQHQHFNINVLGLNEAVRRALSWRVEMIGKHGLKPNRELLDALACVTGMARAGGSFEDVYGGNAEYEGGAVAGWEVNSFLASFGESARQK